MRRIRTAWFCAAFFCVAPAACLIANEPALQSSPDIVRLDRPEGSQQLLITAIGSIAGHSESERHDVTRIAKFEVLDSNIASVSPRGVVVPLGEGSTRILARFESHSLSIPVEVTGLRKPDPVSFQSEVIPILTKARCNSGGCHGKAEGQNGFKLSVFGYDAAADYASVVKEGRGRRVLAAAPEKSPLLLKATASLPHGGGRKIATDSLHFRLLTRWIAEGANFGEEGPGIASLEIEPAQRSMSADETQQLRVTAIDASGYRRCVTAEADYESNSDSIAGVDPQGLVHVGNVPGEAAILVRYRGQVGLCRVTHPLSHVDFERPPEANFVDRHVWNKLQRLGIAPSDIADDATFLRRVFLDTIGTLPTPAEAREFLADQRTDKRKHLIDRLLERDEYADYWTMLWSDLLRVDQDRALPQGAVGMTRWLRRQFAENRPYDEFVRDIVTAQGSAQAESPAAVFKVLDSPELASRSFSQLFLGVRIECAQCHHHPFEKWGQEDYFGLAGFFTGVATKSLPGGSLAIMTKPGTDLKHPRTGDVVRARALGATAVDFSGVSDRRRALADWMTAPENPFFAKVIVNRLWSHYFGRGLVEPIDDFRATNPATNEELLAELAAHIRELRYDLRAFSRTLLNSRAYQLGAKTNPTNAADVQNFSHAADRSLPAEVLLDAISHATETPEKFAGWPQGYRAIQIWDNRLPSYFLKIFGRPLRASVCECERSNDPSISQALHLMNSREIFDKIQDPEGRARQLADSELPPEKIIDELCLATLSRFPSAAERELMLAEYARGDRRAVTEDVLWALLNSKEFLYNH